MKAARACHQCRSSKRRCNRPGPGEPCRSCQLRGISCSAELRRQAVSTKPVRRETLLDDPPRQCQGHSRTPPCLSWAMSVEFVELYLDKIHDQAHSIFHPATLRAQLRNGTVGRALLCAICALGSKFSSYSDRRSLEGRLTAEAKRLLQADIENICIENIQACILVATLCAGICECTSGALFIRIAISMADIMNLGFPTDGTDPVSVVAQETARRVLCSLYVADSWCSSGLGLARHMNKHGLSTSTSCDLPMDEIVFQSLQLGQNDDQATLQVQALGTWKPGLWAHIVTLARHSDPIQELNRQYAKGCTDIAALNETVGHMAHQLEAWSEALPADVQMSVQNLQAQQQRGLGGPFVSLHLMYHHYSTLLYFRFLEDQDRQKVSSSASGARTNAYIARCKHHALSFSSLLSLSRQLKGCKTNCPTIGHMVTVSSSVLVHTLLLGNDASELDGARRALNANFEVLVDLYQIWPATEAMINRLMTFQNVCLLSTDETHRLDGWMVRFLLEHSRALGQRELPCAPENFNLAVGAGSEAILAEKAREWRGLGRYVDLNLPGGSGNKQ
ncbi:hypothetical protein BDW74DRAFT_167995 [Aspergillus multicolor]|uniref:Zn(II)2Cys6 transcription factor n=1 Tax=Aspergillus multicolor TaxID=41759 RepID=UPI003CCD80C1